MAITKYCISGYMVWAKSKLELYEYVRYPDKDSVINYSGPNVRAFYTFLKKVSIDVLGISPTDLHEMAYNWEKKDGKEKFRIEWRAIKEFDDFTHLRFDVNFKGEYNDTDGSITIILKPRLITEYPQDSILQQSIFYEMARTFWHNTFYHKKRWEYLVQSRETWVALEKRIIEFCDKNRGSNNASGHQ